MRLPAMLLSLLAAPALAAPPVYVSMDLDGLSCLGCIDRAATLLMALEPVREARLTTTAACVRLDTTERTAEVVKALRDAGFTPASLRVGDDCSEGLERLDLPELADAPAPVAAEPGNAGPADPSDVWADTGGHDVLTISHGEAVTLEDHLAPGRYTVVDFGASWCGPCHAAAATLRDWMSTRDDTAVRAVSLDGDDTWAVTRQHLSKAPGIPWFVVFSPDGRRIFEGNGVESALDAIRRDKRP